MTGGTAAVIDVETIDADDPVFAPVIKAFDAYGTWALPVVTLNGQVVSVAVSAPGQIAAALDQALKAAVDPSTA
ncbi:hypothetical protein ABFB09_07290 [Dehalogenimonas sp. THU2]|uniref:hypothetical protein n=1 Tax=Dehalogenimonas sp. THU2 TaxID=3151121 RepID=UPI0032184E2B